MSWPTIDIPEPPESVQTTESCFSYLLPWSEPQESFCLQSLVISLIVFPYSPSLYPQTLYLRCVFLGNPSNLPFITINSLSPYLPPPFPLPYTQFTLRAQLNVCEWLEIAFSCFTIDMVQPNAGHSWGTPPFLWERLTKKSSLGATGKAWHV